MTEGGGVNEATPPPSPSRRWDPRGWTPRARRARFVTAAVVLVVAALVAVNLGTSSKPSAGKQDASAAVDKKIAAAVQGIQSAPPPGVGVYDAVRGSIVVIQATGAKDASELGSGIVVNTQGQILTSLHVVQGAASIKVTFADGTESAPTIQASDPNHDSALLAPDRLPQILVRAVLGGTNGLRIGEETFAVGHPLGLV